MWNGMTGRLDGKAAVVTGSGQGIGAAITRCFAAEQARVVVAEVNSDTGAAMAAELKAAGASALFARTDVTDPASVAAMHDAARTYSGRLKDHRGRQSRSLLAKTHP
jgi:NAD(P)-dependent dehydrogenase (short-subunit alcohol dehydrogenase family)